MNDLARKVVGDFRLDVIDWNPKAGLWMNRLWAARSVEGWLIGHLAKPGYSHPADCFHDFRTKRDYCFRLVDEIEETVDQVRGLMDDLGVGQAIVSPDFVVWRDRTDFVFVPLSRGSQEPRGFAELDEACIQYRRQIGWMK